MPLAKRNGDSLRAERAPRGRRMVTRRVQQRDDLRRVSAYSADGDAQRAAARSPPAGGDEPFTAASREGERKREREREQKEEGGGERKGERVRGRKDWRERWRGRGS